TATNSPTSFGATGLPAGLTISTTTGLISGTPSAAGTSSVSLSATNAGGTGTLTLSLTVNPAPPPPPPGSFTKAQPGISAPEILNGGTSISCTFANNPAPGDLVTVAALYYGNSPSGTTISSIKDANNNSYTLTPNSPSTYDSNSGQVFLAYRLSAPANASK